ncbi:sensor histidine kinase [Leisingera sp. S232]|uniref:sensor histidine kinase n=1 Tax=Leisingera sp. S232 TaxID=3415132 RepID=UPI003C7CE706
MFRPADPLTHTVLRVFALLSAAAAGLTGLGLAVFLTPPLQAELPSPWALAAAALFVFGTFAAALFCCVNRLVLRRLAALSPDGCDQHNGPPAEQGTGMLDRIETSLTRHETRIGEQLAQLQSEVSERRAAEQEAKDALAVQTSFLATTSHELRTPLNAMLGLLHLIQIAPDTPPKCKQHARTALSAGQRLLEMVSNTLEAAKLEAKAVTINPHQTDIRRLTRHWLVTAEASLHRRSRDDDVTALLELSPDLDPEYYLDGGRVSQIIGNLTDNASKFTALGKVQIAVSPLAGSKHGLEIRIRDTGEGIPAEVRGQIFERFTQGKQGMSRPHDGAGLGLWICTDLAHLMGGSLELLDAPTAAGFATEFLLKLPLPQAAAL